MGQELEEIGLRSHSRQAASLLLVRWQHVGLEVEMARKLAQVVLLVEDPNSARLRQRPLEPIGSPLGHWPCTAADCLPSSTWALTGAPQDRA